MPSFLERAGSYSPEQEADFCIWIIRFFDWLNIKTKQNKTAQGTSRSYREKESLVLKCIAESKLYHQSGDRCRRKNGKIKILLSINTNTLVTPCSLNTVSFYLMLALGVQCNQVPLLVNANGKKERIHRRV